MYVFFDSGEWCRTECKRQGNCESKCICPQPRGLGDFGNHVVSKYGQLVTETSRPSLPSGRPHASLLAAPRCTPRAVPHAGAGAAPRGTPRGTLRTGARTGARAAPRGTPRGAPRAAPRGTPRTGARAAPRGGPRGAPRAAPRGTPRGAPRAAPRAARRPTGGNSSPMSCFYNSKGERRNVMAAFGVLISFFSMENITFSLEKSYTAAMQVNSTSSVENESLRRIEALLSLTF